MLASRLAETVVARINGNCSTPAGIMIPKALQTDALVSWQDGSTKHLTSSNEHVIQVLVFVSQIGPRNIHHFKILHANLTQSLVLFSQVAASST